MKFCPKCKKAKAFNEFALKKEFKKNEISDGIYLKRCIECNMYKTKEKYLAKQREYQQKNREKLNKNKIENYKNDLPYSLWYGAKTRAKSKKLDFDIEVGDVVIPVVCPVLGIPLFYSSNKLSDYSPTIDRIDNTKGYIKGNIVVVSWRVNKLKNNTTMDVLEKIVAFYKPQEKLKYANELKKSMEWLASKTNTIFLGQAVEYAGTGMSTSLECVEKSRLLEFPVAEDMQMGTTIGIALDGTTVPISIYPRWNFLLLATNQIVNHLDKITQMSDFKPKVIIRTSIGSVRPFDPQHQHKGDFSEAFQLMCPNIEVIRLDEPEDIFAAYKKAYNRQDGKSTILVEFGDYLAEK